MTSAEPSMQEAAARWLPPLDSRCRRDARPCTRKLVPSHFEPRVAETSSGDRRAQSTRTRVQDCFAGFAERDQGQCCARSGVGLASSGATVGCVGRSAKTFLGAVPVGQILFYARQNAERAGAGQAIGRPRRRIWGSKSALPGAFSHGAKFILARPAGTWPRASRASNRGL